MFNNEKPEFLLLRENFYLFNILYPHFRDNDFLQISPIILVSKKRALIASMDESIKMNCKYGLHTITLCCSIS